LIAPAKTSTADARIKYDEQTGTLLENSAPLQFTTLNSSNLHEERIMLIKLYSDKSVDEVATALVIAVPANHFSIMHVHNLQKSMTQKGVEFTRECQVFEVCQPQQAKKVLEQNMSISTALPCRLSLYREDGKTVLATLKPTTLLSMFNAPQLEGAAQEVEDTIVKIMREAMSAGADT
jgi:uncharacterized protein (DUF302 family)